MIQSLPLQKSWFSKPLLDSWTLGILLLEAEKPGFWSQAAWTGIPLNSFICVHYKSLNCSKLQVPQSWKPSLLHHSENSGGDEAWGHAWPSPGKQNQFLLINVFFPWSWITTQKIGVRESFCLSVQCPRLFPQLFSKCSEGRWWSHAGIIREGSWMYL